MARLLRLNSCLLVALGLITLRLVHLQLVRGAAYRRLADQNWLRLVPEPAPRGLIVDRHGQILASNHTIFRAAIIPQELEYLPRILTLVGTLTARPVESLHRTLTRERGFAFMPATIVSSIPKEVALRLEQERWRLPGLFIKAETVRHYPQTVTAAHLLGYLSRPTPEELPLLKQYGVRPTYLVGRLGLERLLDNALRGQPGGVMVQVDHRGRQVRVVGRKVPEPGERVTVTLDASLQSLVEEALGTQAGAAVVLDPDTGEVLAMASAPRFDPELFVTGDTPAVQRLLDDPDTPLMNRATLGVYQPGSILKLATAGAALEHRVITPTTTITCDGALTIGNRTFHCWNRDGHGPVALPEALMHSCNVYFMQVGRRLGAVRLRTALERMGLAHRTGWVLEEQRGHVPQRPLTEGEVALLAIGQGEVLITPLQAAVMAAAMANGGWLVEPRIVRTIGTRAAPWRAARRRLGWSRDTLEEIRAGMRAVVAEPEGTGHGAFSPRVAISGKTGTAQTHVPGQPHGWFVGFCPSEAPRAAMAIVAEFGGSGGGLPAEIGRAVCEYLVTAEASR